MHEVATIPVWAKMTPNITDITVPGRACLGMGMEGISAINTITSVMGINLDTLKPELNVEVRDKERVDRAGGMVDRVGC